MALVHWILVVAWHLCTGSWWWRGIGALDPGGGVALVHIEFWCWHSMRSGSSVSLDSCGCIALNLCCCVWWH